MIGSLLIGPFFLADLSLDEDFLTLLAMLGEGFCGFTPQLEVDEGGDGFTVARLRLIRVVIGECDFDEAFAVLSVGEFGIGDEVAVDILPGLKAGDSGYAAEAASTADSCFTERPDSTDSPQAKTACPAAKMFRAAFKSASSQ